MYYNIMWSLSKIKDLKYNLCYNTYEQIESFKGE